MAKFEEYADLIVRTGANVQPGQRVVLRCPVELRAFAHALADKAYDAGAKEVVTMWNDELLTRKKYLRAADEIFDEVPEWLRRFCDGYAEENAALISVYAENPENLKDVDPERIKRNAVASGNALEDYYNKMLANRFRWCVVSYPTKAWAEKVFPGDPDAEGKLLEAIYELSGVSDKPGETVAFWTKKLETMNKIADRLNALNIKTLTYKNALGTDFSTDLARKAIWTAAGEKAQDGVTFTANIPTEEIFTLPEKSSANGVVYASKPLALNGNVVKGIRFTFKDGKIVEAHADENYETLAKELEVDEGARFLGEIALVPYDSPISRMNTLFYNTLFDENASCHLAFGAGYPMFPDRDDVPREEHLARGMNDSHTHVDFMMGTSDLSVTALTGDGRTVKIFTDGNFDPELLK